MSSFTGSFGNDSRSTRPFDDDGYLGYDPRLPSQRFDSFSNFDTDSVKDSTNDDVFSSQRAPSINASGTDLSAFLAEQNGKGFDGDFGLSDGPILPPPSELQPGEGFALREWRRLNATRLEEKENKEKEILQQIIEEAEQYKAEFYRKRNFTIENKKAANREKEKLFLSSQEKFHAEAEKNYWKAITELIPREVPAIEKRGKKNQEKKPSIVVIQGPKPGKPTDLSRMRHILVKLKHNPPPHIKVKPPPSEESEKDAKTVPPPAASGSGNASVPPPKAAVASTSEAVAAA